MSTTREGLSYFTAIVLVCLQGWLSNGQVIELQFSQNLYQSTLIKDVTTVPGSHVATLGFNRPLLSTENLLFLPETTKLSFNASSLELILEQSINSSFWVVVGVTSGTLKTAKIDVIVINPEQVCQTQAAGSCSQICTPSPASQSGYNCSCIDGYTLHTDRRTCIASNPSPLILLSHGNRVSQLDTFRRESSPLHQLINNNSITLFDYDYKKQLLYFLNETLLQIVRTSLSSTDSSVVPIVSSGIGSVSGLAVDWISGNVLYSDSILGKIQTFHATTGHVTPVLTGLKSPRAIVLIPDQPFRYLFWIEETSDNHYSIRRSSLNGSMVVTVIENLVKPVAMAMDVVMEQLYWIDINNGGVTVSRSLFDGSGLEEVYTSDNQSFDSIAVFEDYIYLSSLTSSKITRINKLELEVQSRVEYLLDFSGIQELRILHPLAQPLAVDNDECLINNGGCNQGCVNTIGSFYCTCIHGYNLLDDQMTCINHNNCSVDELGCDQGCGLDDNDNQICLCSPGYKLDSDGKTCSDINECLTEDFCSHGCHNTVGGYKCSCPEGLFIGPDHRNCIGCSINNGGCSQTCVTLSDTFQCQCETGYTLGSDQRSCFPEQASSLIASVQRGTDLMNVIETTPNGVYLNTLVKLSNTQSGVSATGDVFGMDVDSTNGFLYFGDRNNSGLFRVKISDVSTSTDGRTRIVDNVKIWGVAYDWVNEYVYWTEDMTGKVKRVRTNSSSFLPEVVLENLDTPQGLTIEPFTNYIYWTEGGASPRIARASLLDPSSTNQTIVSSLGNPTGITIDYLNSKLIWVDQLNRSISYSNLDGLDVMDLLTTPIGQSPFQIVVTGDKLYWSTAGWSGGVEFGVVTLYDSSTMFSLSLEGFSATSINGLTIVDENKKPGNGYHACLVNALGCSHYCSINGDGEAVCTCPVGYVLLQDGTTCANVFSCPGSRSCDGSFANTTGTPFFTRPSMMGQLLNSDDTPLMVSGQVLQSCDLLSVEYLDHSCSYETITENILTVVGSGLYVIDANNLIWTNLNGRIITITLSCSSPHIDGSFCVNFEVSSLDRAVSCGFSNGGCSDFCTTEFSPIPMCSCPNGQILGQNGYDCIDPCQPNPCQNGGACSTDPQGSVLCSCPVSHSGPFCSIPSQPSCPQDLCKSTANSISVQRHVGGDLVKPSMSTSEVFCNAVNGYCTGGKVGSCEACQCGPQDSFMFNTKRCSEEGCLYKFGQVSQQAPPMYIQNNQLISVATGNKLPIVLSKTGSPPSGECMIHKVEVDTGDGWTPVSLNGIKLEVVGGATYLNVTSSSLLSQLRGQLVRATLNCTGEGNGCLVFSFYGNGIDLSLTEICDSCEGYLEGYENLGVPVVSGPSSDANGDFILSDLNIIYNGNVMDNCNELGTPRYYDDQCGIVPVPDNLIYATQNRLHGRNSASDSWDTIAGRVINITLSCNSIEFCLLIQIDDIQDGDTSTPCSPNPCENNGICKTIGKTDFYCSCQTGFIGITCSNTDRCLHHRCLNNGTCINGPGYATCMCPQNTIRPFCIGPDDKNFGPCELSPCNNGGTCIEDSKTGYFCKCEIGFTGVHCDLDDPCIPNPCTFNSSCTPVGSEFVCGISGGEGNQLGGEESGSGNINECDPNPCQNGGSCAEGSPGEFTCTCLTGYTGSTCAIDINECDPNPCQNGGLCAEGSPGEFTCTCPTGYTGSTCAIDINECDPNPCQNGGSCAEGSPGEFTCTCPTGYTGSTCAIDINECDPNPCQNGGSCAEGSPGEFTCTCLTGYTGSTCAIDINECDPNPCQNGGSCAEGSPGEFTCTCPTGYTGSTCAIDIDECDPNPCQNGGSCAEGSPGEFTCTCPTGYTGSTCAIDINECDPNPCQNGGSCAEGSPGEFTCTCPTGYTGSTCAIDINECDPNPCQNGGSCAEGSPGEFTCTCLTGYTGSTCAIDINECDPNPCQNGGSCAEGSPGEFTCTCLTGYTGSTCAIDINECDPNPCQNGGSCAEGSPGEFTCTCLTGYTGSTCAIDINECDPNPCLNRGTCSEPAVGEFLCDCTAEYTGVTCEVDFNECAGENPCQNGGTCVNRSPGFGCQCPGGYIGDRCEQQCPDGLFGEGCSQTCDCLNGASCDHVTGVCICNGYTGTRCQTPVCENGCQNGGTCVSPDVCSCVVTFTGPTCSERECTDEFCNNRGVCELNILDQPSCTCQSGFTGSTCEFTSGRLSSQERGGVSAGAVIGAVIIVVIIVAVLFFAFKVVIPYYRRKKARQSLWYLDTTLVRENPAVAQDLLESGDIAREFRDRGLTQPLDNPLYGYVPPQIHSKSGPYEESYASVPTEGSEEEGSDQEEEEQDERSPFRPDVIPNSVIVNRCIDARSPDGSGEDLERSSSVSPDVQQGERDSRIEGRRSEWRTTDKRNSGSGGNIV